jgi:hypothetical protein
VQEQISFHLGKPREAAEWEDVRSHLGSCRKCVEWLEAREEMRTVVSRLEVPRMPAALAVQLRVMASHERVRRLARVSFRARLGRWNDRIRLAFDNLMRPLALPLAGGVFSALLLFGMLVPNLIFRHEFSNEPPLSFTDPDGLLVNLVDGYIPRLEPLDFVTTSDDNVLELTIDDEGRVVDYDVRQGQWTPEMISIIQWSNFTPAKFFGKPTWGKKLVVQPRRRSNARG